MSTARSIAATLIACLGALLLWWPAFRTPLATGFGDWQMVHHNWEVGYVALTRFGEWPLWDPFFCGGVPMFGNPESQHFSPLFALSLLLGTTLATKLFVVAHAAAGLWGMYAFARAELGVRPLSAALSAVAWGWSGFFAWHGSGGHATFLPFYFAPALLLCCRRATRTDTETPLAYAALTALLLALVIYEGGTYPFPYFVLLLAWDTLSALRGPRRAVLHALRACALMAALTLLLGAVRLLPIHAALSRMPRTMPSEDFLTPGEILLMLTARDHDWFFVPHRFVWPEYGTFVGFGVLALGGVGVLLSAWRRRHSLWLGTGLFLLFTMGERSAFFPWSLVHELPVFDSLRVPSRFAVLFTFYLALCAGLALDELATWLERIPVAISRRIAQATCLVVLAGISCDLLIVNRVTVDRWQEPPIATTAPAQRFHLLRVYDFYNLYASLPARNLGIAACYAGGMNWVVSNALWPGDVPQARVSRGTGEVLAFSRTVNTASLRVRAETPVHVVINQNYDPDFRASVGSVSVDRGRLALDLPAGSAEVVLRYAPPTLVPGLALSLLGLALALSLLRRKREPTP